MEEKETGIRGEMKKDPEHSIMSNNFEKDKRQKKTSELRGSEKIIMREYFEGMRWSVRWRNEITCISKDGVDTTCVEECF